MPCARQLRIEAPSFDGQADTLRVLPVDDSMRRLQTNQLTKMRSAD
jgi:hypothetical protein